MVGFYFISIVLTQYNNLCVTPHIANTLIHDVTGCTVNLDISVGYVITACTYIYHCMHAAWPWVTWLWHWIHNNIISITSIYSPIQTMFNQVTCYGMYYITGTLVVNLNANVLHVYTSDHWHWVHVLQVQWKFTLLAALLLFTAPGLLPGGIHNLPHSILKQIILLQLTNNDVSHTDRL